VATQMAVTVLAARPAASPAGLAGLLGAWVAALDERRRVVFEHRVARADRLAGDIGRQYGVSGDRIRRQERVLSADLSAWLRRPPAAAPVAAVRAGLRSACLVIAPWDEAARVVPELSEPVPGTGACLGDLSGFLFPGLHRDGPWIAWRPVAGLREQTAQVATAAVPAARRSALLGAYRQALGLAGPHWDAWLECCGLRAFRGLVVRSAATIPDLAEAVLAERGQPMATADIARQIPVPPWKVRDCGLGRDDRFSRTRVGVFGLAEWGLPAYRGIRGHIIEQIAASGGQARLDHVVEDLVGRFGVSKASVYAYARGPEFARAGSMICLADPGTARPA